MINQFKKWLTVGTVNSKFNLFRTAIIGELIMIIVLVVCLCSIINLKKENKDLKEKIKAQTTYIDHTYKNVLEPLGL